MDNGYRWAVDIDLEKYFDTVNHDNLKSMLAFIVITPKVLTAIKL